MYYSAILFYTADTLYKSAVLWYNLRQVILPRGFCRVKIRYIGQEYGNEKLL